MLSDPFLEKVLAEDNPHEFRKTPFRVVPITDAAKLETHLQYAKLMAEALKETNIEKRPVSKIQAASAQRVLDMNEEEIKAYRARPMPTKEQAQVETDAEKIMETHAGGMQEFFIAEKLRHTHHANDLGDCGPDAEGTNPIKKENAIDAYMTTKAELSPLEMHFIKEGHTDDGHYPVPETPKRAFWRRLLDAKWIWIAEDYKPSSWRDLK